MSEVIVKLTGDRIRVKGGEYVRDIVRCKECKRSEASLNDGCVYCTQLMWTMNPDDFCSYGERDKDTNVPNKQQTERSE